MPLFISLKVASIATLITVALGIPLAYAMAHYRGRSQSVIDGILLFPLVLPPTVIGFTLLWLLGRNGPFSFLPISIVFTWWAAVLTAVIVALPLMYRSSRAAFDQVDDQLLQVARTLGASEWRVFHQIALPLAGPGILSGTLLSFARALGEFGATLMLAGNIPGKTQTLPMAVYFAVEGGDFATAARWSGVMGVIALTTVILSKTLSHTHKPTFSISPPVRATDVHATATPDTQYGLPVVTQPRENTALTVNITKKLARFTLRIHCSTHASLLGVLGASGAGKSLLLKCLAGTEKPDSGKILLGDRILFDSQKGIDLPSRDRKIAFLYQNYALFPHLTVAQNIAFGIQSQPNHRQIVAEELAAVQLSNYAQAYPHQLSGGQQQRIALARALATRPLLLLLDEPLSALDTHLRSHLSQQLFQRLQTYTGMTLLVSHNLEETYRAEELLVLHQGEAVKQAKPQEIFERPGRSVIAQLTGSMNQSPLQITGAGLYATHWQMNIQFTASNELRLSKKNKTRETSNLQEKTGFSPFLVGIRPQNVLIITNDQYRSSQDISQPTVKIATQRDVSASLGAIADQPEINNAHNQKEHNQKEHNQALCWLAAHRTYPQTITLALKLHSPALSVSDYHLQVIVTYRTWKILENQPLPWTVYLPPEHLILLQS